MRGVKANATAGRRVLAAASGTVIALAVGIAASSAISASAAGGARGPAAATPRPDPGGGFSITLERRGGSAGRVAPGAAVPYWIGIRLPAGRTQDVTVAVVTDPVSVTLSADCPKPAATPATSPPFTRAPSPVPVPSTASPKPGPSASGTVTAAPTAGSPPPVIPVPAPDYQPAVGYLPASLTGAAAAGTWRPACVVAVSGTRFLRAAVHVPGSMAADTAMQIAVLGVALPVAANAGGSVAPLLSIAYASLRTRPADDDDDDGTHTSPPPATTAPATAASLEGYLASMAAAFGKAPSTAVAAALRNLATALQQLASALPTTAATSTPLPSSSKKAHASPSASSSLLPLIPSSSPGRAAPTSSPSPSSSGTSAASSHAGAASSSSANLNWPDAAVLIVIVAAILVVLWRRLRRPTTWPGNRR